MAQTVIRDRSASDALTKIRKKRLVNGVNVVHNFTVDRKRLKLAAVIRGKRLVDWRILDANGKRVPSELVKVMRKKKPTCWRCVEDREGNLHCFMIPCPDIPLPPFGTNAFLKAIEKIGL